MRANLLGEADQCLPEQDGHANLHAAAFSLGDREVMGNHRRPPSDTL